MRRFPLVLLLLAGCAAEPRCAPPLAPMLRAELFFGREGVDDPAWEAFVREELTAAFPDGLTVVPARGQWRDPRTGALVREPSALAIVLFEPGGEGRLAAVSEAYARKHGQQSVGIALSQACASF